MSKRIEKQIDSFKYKGEPIKITLGTLILTCLSVLFIIVATFTQITIKHPYFPLDTFSFLAQDVNDYEILHHFIKSYKYIPQIPMVFFIVAIWDSFDFNVYNSRVIFPDICPRRRR